MEQYLFEFERDGATVKGDLLDLRTALAVSFESNPAEVFKLTSSENPVQSLQAIAECVRAGRKAFGLPEWDGEKGSPSGYVWETVKRLLAAVQKKSVSTSESPTSPSPSELTSPSA